MPLTTLTKINHHLPEDKLDMGQADLNEFLVSVTPVVLGMLSGTFSSTTLNNWTTGDTPDYIEEAVARIIAGMFYNRTVSEEEPSGNDYANGLYSQGMMMLNQVKNGSVILSDVAEIAVDGRFLSTDFYPNKTNLPVFTMDSRF